MSTTIYTEVLDFWFAESTQKLWFNSSAEFDNVIHTKYKSLWEQASSGQLKHWRKTALGSLSLVIVLDQFPLNMFRGTAMSFSTAQHAVSITRTALSKNFHKQLNIIQLPFLYMPLMHSESLEDQDDSVRLFEAAGLDSNLRFAKHHRSIIKKFGRFPHRNKLLNRESSIDELEYLNSRQAFKG